MQPEHRGEIPSWVAPARQQCSLPLFHAVVGKDASRYDQRQVCVSSLILSQQGSNKLPVHAYYLLLQIGLTKTEKLNYSMTKLRQTDDTVFIPDSISSINNSYYWAAAEQQKQLLLAQLASTQQRLLGRGSGPAPVVVRHRSGD